MKLIDSITESLMRERLDHSISDIYVKSSNKYSKKIKDNSLKLTLAIAMDLSSK